VMSQVRMWSPIALAADIAEDFCRAAMTALPRVATYMARVHVTLTRPYKSI
jgi:hypothetical protein